MSNLTGKGVIALATFLIATLKQQNKSKGKTRIKAFDGKPTRVFVMRNEDMAVFTEQAKKYGILYAAILDKKSKDDPNGIVDVVVNANDAAKVNRISERFALSADEVEKIRQEVVKSQKNRQQSAEKERTEPSAEKTHSVDDNTLSKIMGEPSPGKTEHKQPVDISQENPTVAGMEQKSSNLSAPSSERSRTLGEDGSIERERPSVRQQIKEIKAERKEKAAKQPEKIRETVHEAPVKKKVSEKER